MKNGRSSLDSSHDGNYVKACRNVGLLYHDFDLQIRSHSKEGNKKGQLLTYVVVKYVNKIFTLQERERERERFYSPNTIIKS